MSFIIEDEFALEKKLIEKLENELGYQKVDIKDLNDLEKNFRKQLNKHNVDRLKGKELTDEQFKEILDNILYKNVFDSAIILREKIPIHNEKGEKNLIIELFNKIEWCQNEFQVANQIEMEPESGTKKIGDVTILINGLPLVQIELKKTGSNYTKAFQQIKNYSAEAYKGLFRFIQLFIISDNATTKYFANNNLKNLTHQYIFDWNNEKNEIIGNLLEFSSVFLQKCFVARIIARYMVIDNQDKKLIVMRPHQIHAVEEIIQLAKDTNTKGYVWHSTGSGKTLTSFKLSQLLKETVPEAQIFFLVDRKDLDYQTVHEFNKFQKNSVESTENIYQLKAKLKDKNENLILTTIQKMSSLSKKQKYEPLFQRFENKKVIFIIDECHRSVSGEMLYHIRKRFAKTKMQLFGFTGTPIFVDENDKVQNTKNFPKLRDTNTTEAIFGKRVHEYLMDSAIKDECVLPLKISYYYKRETKNNFTLLTKKNKSDERRLKLIAHGILNIHNQETLDKQFNAIFAVNSTKDLVKYYDIFKDLLEKGYKGHDKNNFKIAAIFSSDEKSDGNYEIKLNSKKASKEDLKKIIEDYNITFDEKI